MAPLAIFPANVAISCSSRCLLGIHQRHAARQHHAQPAAQLIAHLRKPLRLRSLPLQAVHLTRHFFKNIVHARQVLLRAFQPQLRQPLLRLEARNPRSLFDNRPPVVWLRAQQLPDPLLPDNRVALRPQARSHKNVLDIAKPAQLSIQQIFALARPEQPPRDHHFTLLRGAIELPPSNLQHHRLRSARARLNSPFGFGPLRLHAALSSTVFILEHLPRLFRRNNLLRLGSLLPP